jgi:predicted RNA binding protein YcfA (HicA-like mRNA interferase family)
MRVPRGLSGQDLVKALKKYGYAPVRQTGAHIRITTQQKGEHHVTVPNHDALRIGTLSSILKEVADHLQRNRDQLIEELFG